MNLRPLLRHCAHPAGLGLMVSLLSACQVDHIQIGQVFMLYTPKAGACPVLEWQFFVDAHRTFQGTLIRDGKPIGNFTGPLNQDDTFRWTVTSTVGNGTATVTGGITQRYTALAIDGAGAGAECNGQSYRLTSNYFQFYGGGGGR